MGDKIISTIKLPLKTKKSVEEALATLELLDAAIEERMTDPAIVELVELQEQRAKIDGGIKQFAVDKGDYEDEHYKVTRVQGHSRKWDGTKLEKLMPKGLFLKVVDYTPNAEKIDALVKAGKIDRKKIQSAFIETPNRPYGKITRKVEGDGASGEDEAASLAAKLR